MIFKIPKKHIFENASLFLYEMEKYSWQLILRVRKKEFDNSGMKLEKLQPLVKEIVTLLFTFRMSCC